MREQDNKAALKSAEMNDSEVIDDTSKDDDLILEGMDEFDESAIESDDDDADDADTDVFQPGNIRSR